MKRVLRKIGWYFFGLVSQGIIYGLEGALVNKIMNIWATHNAEELFSFRESNSLSEAILLHATSMLDRK